MDSNMGDVNVPRKVRINGGLMGNYLNEHVILKGFFNMVSFISLLYTLAYNHCLG